MVTPSWCEQTLRHPKRPVCEVVHNRQLADENQKMRREIEAQKTDRRALERAAREELGYVKPGEIVINLE